ncbi:hypothetical protein AX16_004386 [Volvariella volvacea WC 439]|nr:hypothetical protein AX16_004386 [Volvariella volvacea WC 439]
MALIYLRTRSSQIEMQIYSPSVRVQEEKRGSWGPLAVFSENDPIGGRVILDPSCSYSGRLTVFIEGSFIYEPDHSTDADSTAGHAPDVTRRKHVFFHTSTSMPVSPTFETSPSRPGFREALAASVRRRPSASSIGSSSPVERSYPFSFDLPKGCRSGEELPSSFSTSRDSEDGSEFFEVAYKVGATWEATSLDGPAFSLEVPILYCPDPDFHSLDEQKNPTSWLEMPLRSDRPIPFRCAVTLPTTVTFSRSSSIPYFVVFTTTPRSPSLAKEIAADATISISLQRQITLTENMSLPPTPPQTPPSSGEESETPRGNLFKRVKSVQPRLRRRAKTLEEIPDIKETTAPPLRAIVDKPLPRLPTQTVFSESRSLQNIICIGFPKRPRNPTDNHKLQATNPPMSLPDGLHKGKISLSRDMLPCIDWSGLNVKYYLDVSVLIGQDDLRARIPIRLY